MNHLADCSLMKEDGFSQRMSDFGEERGSLVAVRRLVALHPFKLHLKVSPEKRNKNTDL